MHGISVTYLKLENESFAAGNSVDFRMTICCGPPANLRFPEYPEYVLDHVQNLSNSSLIHILPIPRISRKSTCNFSGYSANRETDRQMWMIT